jgi:hypothetical protein
MQHRLAGEAAVDQDTRHPADLAPRRLDADARSQAAAVSTTTASLVCSTMTFSPALRSLDGA